MEDTVSEWRLYVKRTGPGRRYLYRQRNVKGADGKWHTESYSLGRVDADLYKVPKRRLRDRIILLHALGFAVAGERYGDWLDGKRKPEPKPDEKKEAPPEEEPLKGAGAGNGEPEEPSE